MYPKKDISDTTLAKRKNKSSLTLVKTTNSKGKNSGNSNKAKRIPSVLEDFAVKQINLAEIFSKKLPSLKKSVMSNSRNKSIKNDNGKNSTSISSKLNFESLDMEQKQQKDTKNTNTNNNLNEIANINSECPTAVIAPYDYIQVIKNVDKLSGKTKDKQKAADTIPSDTPTALIAPSDYFHLYKNPQQKKIPLKEIKSDTPTALFAPSDYVHMYKNNKFSKNKKDKIATAFKSDTPTAVIAPSDYVHLYKNPQKIKTKFTEFKSDTPTAIIAPSDYVHLYKNHENRKQIPLKEIKSDTPTALFAPSDYVHMYKNNKITKLKSSNKIVKMVKSDTPTAVIAPSDYVHLYKNPQKKQIKLTEIKSDTPTALFAPSDYVHLYKNIKTQNNKKKVKNNGNKSLNKKLNKDKNVNGLTEIVSDTPTALIAPSDYVHFYKNPKISTPTKEKFRNKKNRKKELETEQYNNDTPKEYSIPNTNENKFNKNFGKRRPMVKSSNNKRIIIIKNGVPESLIETIENFISTLKPGLN